MNALPKLGFVASHVNVTYDRFRGRKNVVPGGPQTTAHDNFFPHKDPRQEWIKRYFSEEVTVRDKVPCGSKRSKTRVLQLFLVVDGRSCENKTSTIVRLSFTNPNNRQKETSDAPSNRIICASRSDVAKTGPHKRLVGMCLRLSRSTVCPGG